MGTAPEPRPCVQVKVGKSQRAALTVDVESGTVTVTKRGSGSPEEVISQDKSKGCCPPAGCQWDFWGCRVPCTGLMPRGWATCAVTPQAPVPHCPVVGGGGHHRPPDPLTPFSPAADQVPECAEQGEAGVCPRQPEEPEQGLHLPQRAGERHWPCPRLVLGEYGALGNMGNSKSVVSGLRPPLQATFYTWG